MFGQIVARVCEALSACDGPSAEISTISAIERESLRAALIEEFGIEVLGEGKVRLKLHGISRNNFLRKVQEAVTDPSARQPSYEEAELLSDWATSSRLIDLRPAIYHPYLEQWPGNEVFSRICNREIAVDGNVEGSTWLSRSVQEIRGWNNVDLRDLSVAHAAYLLATGKDLFGGNVVRARYQALYFGAHGFVVPYYIWDDPFVGYHYVAASAALPSRGK